MNAAESTTSDVNTTVCPRCGRTLFAGPAEGVGLLGCGTCGGVWLDARGCRTLVRGASENLIALGEQAERAATVDVAVAVANGIACPVCRRELAPGAIPGTTTAFATCADHGTWFDRGMLPAVARAYRAATFPAPAPVATPLQTSVPASRRSRLIAAVVDSAIAVAATVPAALLGVYLAATFPGQGWLVVALPALVLLGYSVLQGVGLAVRGQTLGKALEGTKVVQVDGSAADILRAVFLRSMTLPFAAFLADGAASATDGLLGAVASTVASVANLAVAVDVWLIWLPPRRALHDYLAGTMVVEVYVPPKRKAVARWIFVGAMTLWVASILAAVGWAVTSC